MFKTQYAKVVYSTLVPSEETKKMIGGIYEFRAIYFPYKEVALYNKDKSDYWWFNFSDVLPATEEEYRNQFKAQFEKKGEIEEIDEVPTDCDYLSLTEKVNELVRAVNKIK